MPYCSHCGQEVERDQDYCLQCGRVLRRSDTRGEESLPDYGGAGWGLLGFCFPLVGLILFLVWNTTRPRTAKAAGIGALISVVFSFGVYIFYAAIFSFAHCMFV